MNIMSWISDTIMSPLTTLVKGWQKRKTARVEHELQLAEAQTLSKIERLKSAQDHTFAWERDALKNAGWKDEFFVIIFSIPLIMCFIPGMDYYVIMGFDALKGTPDWYQWAISIMVAASFGYRKFADAMSLKKGS